MLCGDAPLVLVFFVVWEMRANFPQSSTLEPATSSKNSTDLFSKSSTGAVPIQTSEVTLRCSFPMSSLMVNWDVPACGHLMPRPLQCMKNWKKPNDEGHLESVDPTGEKRMEENHNFRLKFSNGFLCFFFKRKSEVGNFWIFF